MKQESMTTDITFNINSQKALGTLCKAGVEKTALLIIAGGGNIPRNEGHYPSWREHFADQGITTFNFDFRGVGESKGELKNTSLKTRAEDAAAALDVLKKSTNTENVYVMGVSMGAPVAIQIVDSSINGLLLIVPAAYSSEAHDRKFGPDFSEAIRKTESWRDSPDFKKLGEYNGKLFLLYGTQDEIVPEGVFSEYEKIVSSKNGTILALPNEGHKSWVTSQSDLVLHSLVQFIMA